MMKTPAAVRSLLVMGVALLGTVMAAIPAQTADNRLAPWIEAGRTFPSISLPSLEGDGKISFPPRNGKPSLVHIFGSW